MTEPISYANLAIAAGVLEQRLKSIIRMAMTNGLFIEQPGGKSVGHSATSAFVARSDDVYAWAKYICTKTAPMALALADAHQRWGPETVKKNETAYNVAFDTDLPFFDHISRDESSTREFAAYMRNVTSSKGMDLQHLVGGFAWSGIKEGGIVVDVSFAFFILSSWRKETQRSRLTSFGLDRSEDRVAAQPSG